MAKTNNGLTLAEKLKLIDKISDEVNSKAGKVIAGRLSKNKEMLDKLTIKFIPSVCHDFNVATGGGYPRGRCTLISGLSDVGKTSRVLEDIGYNMKQDQSFVALWVETENSLDKDMISGTFDIDLNRFIILDYDPNLGAEGILDIISGYMTAAPFDMVVINSLKALVPTKILEEDMSMQTPAIQARLWSKMSMKFTSLVAEGNTAFILITHMYTGIGTYMSPQVISGGMAIKYWSGLTMSFAKKTLGAGDPISKEEGMHVEVTIKKNRNFSDRLPYQKFDYYVIFGEGTETILTNLASFINAGLLQAKGSYIYLLDDKGEKVESFQGKQKYRQYMIDHPDVYEKLVAKLPTTSTVTALSEEEVADIEREENEADNIVDQIEIEDPK